MTYLATQRELLKQQRRILRDAVGNSYVVANEKVPVELPRPLAPKKRTVTRDDFAAYAATASRIDAAPFQADIDGCVDSELS